MLFALLKYPVEFHITEMFPQMLTEYNKIIATATHQSNRLEHLPYILNMISAFEIKWNQQDHIEHFVESLKQCYSRANARFCEIQYN